MVWHKTHEWEKTHTVGEGWMVIGEVKHKKSGLPMALLFNGRLASPWSVQYAGTGHYFGTLLEANEYAKERMKKP